MSKLSGLHFSNTNRHQLVLVIRIYFEKNLNYPKVEEAGILVKKKSPHKYPIYWICSKPSTRYSKHRSKFIAGDWVKQIWSYRAAPFLLRDLVISCGWISLSKTYACLEGNIFVYEKKTDISIPKLTIRNLYCCFSTKTQYSFIIDYRDVRKPWKISNFKLFEALKQALEGVKMLE